jgi:hypothetical protein
VLILIRRFKDPNPRAPGPLVAARPSRISPLRRARIKIPVLMIAGD